MTAGGGEWIVIADGEHARFLTRAPHAAFHTIKVLKAGAAALPAQAHDRFAALVAAHLNAAAGAGMFDRLVLAAPARMLHALEADLDHPALARVTYRIQKDLTHVPNGELAPHLPPWPAAH